MFWNASNKRDRIHTSQEHVFSVNNILKATVNVNEFLDVLEQKLTSLHCLFCEKIFKDRTSLKDHMRKKQHKKINPKNKEYDRFYIINYLELGKTWEDIQNENEVEENELRTDGSADEDDWSDWKGDLPPSVCLFCEASFPVTGEVIQHMKDKHSFDFLTIKRSLDVQEKLCEVPRELSFKNGRLGTYDEGTTLHLTRRQNCVGSASTLFSNL